MMPKRYRTHPERMPDDAGRHTESMLFIFIFIFKS